MKAKTTLLLIAALLISASSIAQWQPTRGLYSGYVHSIIINNGQIICGTSAIYKSSDDGKTWYLSNNGMSGSIMYIWSIVKSGTNLIAGTNEGIYYSTDNGDNWNLASGTSAMNIWKLCVKGSNVFAATSSNGIYKSINNGQNWSASSTGITTPYLDMRCIVVMGSDLYAGTDGHGIFKSTNDGASWSTVNTGLPGSYYSVSCLGVVGTTLIAGTYGAGVYKSTNGGSSWSAINNGINSNDDMMGIGVNGTSVYASTMTGNLLKTTDLTNWNALGPVTIGIPRYEAFYANGSSFYIGSWAASYTERAHGLFRTMDDGISWKQVGITEMQVSALEVAGSNILAGTVDPTGNTFRTTLYKTTEADSTWVYNPGNFDGANITAIKASGTTAYLFSYDCPGSSYCYRSTNSGNNWTSTGTDAIYNRFNTFAIAGSLIYAGDNFVYVSSDNGQTWTQVSSGIPSGVTSIYSLAIKGTLVFAATNNGIYKNTVGSNSWTAASSGLTNLIVRSIIVSGTTLFAGTQGGGIFKSTNDGGVWVAAGTGIPLYSNVTTFASSGTNVYAGCDHGVFWTGNGGSSWMPVNTGLADTNVTVLAASTNYLWAGTNSEGVWRRALSEIITSVSENSSKQNHLEISPNPAVDQTMISFPEETGGSLYEVHIWDMNGRCIFSTHSSEKNLIIPLNGFRSGMYMIQAVVKDKSYTNRLIVE
jgi:hypothetical protein